MIVKVFIGHFLFIFNSLRLLSKLQLINQQSHISYELINHQEKIVGQDVSKAITKQIGVEALSEFKNCTKELKSVTSKYHKKLNYIRNKLFGHRTTNGSEMAMSMLEIDASEIYNIGRRIFDVYIKVLAEYADLLSKL